MRRIWLVGILGVMACAKAQPQFVSPPTALTFTAAWSDNLEICVEVEHGTPCMTLFEIRRIYRGLERTESSR